MDLQELTRDEVLYIMPLAKKRVDKYLPWINKYAPKYGVTTTKRMAHFLAQIAQESGQLRYAQEIASGKAYEGRKDLGNTVKGDGVRYKGRGLIQITGRSNYNAVSKALGVDFVAHPEKLEEPEWAVASALWYWQSHGCNELADKDDSLAVTRRINGGTNGLDDRLRYLGRARQVFRELCIIVCLVVMLVSCTTSQYVPIETARTEYKNRTDTVIQKDTVEREKTITIMEADSALLAQYGILLRENRNTQAAYLIIQKELEREKSKKLEVHTDTIFWTDTVQVPVPVECKLSKWESFCIDYGKIMVGATAAAILGIVFIVVWLLSRRPNRRLL